MSYYLDTTYQTQKEQQKVFAGFLPSGWETCNREAWQELLNDFRVLCYLKLCVFKLWNRPKTAAMLQLAENAAHRKNPQRATETEGGSCFYQEILLYRIPNIAFIHSIWRGCGVPCSSQCFETAHPTKSQERFPVLPSQVVQLQGRKVLLPPWLSLMLAVDSLQCANTSYAKYLGPGSTAFLL